MQPKKGLILATLIGVTTGAKLGKGADTTQEVGALRIDSRLVTFGDIFVAFKGEAVDGHRFLSVAVENGASCLIVDAIWAQQHSEEFLIQNPSAVLMPTDNAVELMARLASVYREFYSQIPFIAITGSCGKTTVKNMLGHVLGQFCEPLVTLASQNNHLGVPMTISRLVPSTQVGVAELGANSIGEIAQGVALVQPMVAVLTGVNTAHIEGFGSIENTARAKSEILEDLGPEGVAVLNKDDHFFDVFCESVPEGARILTFGYHPDSDIRVSDTGVYLSKRLASFHVPQELLEGEITFELPLFGEHNRVNAVISLACIFGLLAQRRLSWQDDFYEKLGVVFKGLKPSPGRLEPHYLGSTLVLDDTYNAAPAAVMSSLKCLSQQQKPLWFIFGDMAELGDMAQDAHIDVGRVAAEYGIDQFWAYGELASVSAEAYAKSCAGPIACFSQRKGMKAALQQALLHQPPGTILVKGSRSQKMEQIVQHLRDSNPVKK